MRNLIGIEPLKEAVLKAEKEGNFLFPGVLTNFILNIPSGNGRTSVLKSLSRYLYDAQMRDFGSGEHFLEYKIDEYAYSIPKIQDIFGSIKANADYTNEFSGVIGFDTDFLAKRLNEKPTEFFLEKAGELSAFSTLVFFIPDDNSPGTQKLAEKLMEIEDTDIIEIPPYSKSELAKIALESVYENGAFIDEREGFLSEIESLFEISEVKSAKEASTFGRKLLSFSEEKEGRKLITLEKTFGISAEEGEK